MFFKASKTKMSNGDDDRAFSFINPRHRARSATHLLTPDIASTRSTSSNQDRSLTPSSTSSSSSLVVSNSPKPTSSSFLKVSTSNRSANSSPSSSDDLFVMTIIKSPAVSSQRTQTNESVGTTVVNEELSSNNKFLKSKVTAALNHMKYRKFIHKSIDIFSSLSSLLLGWVVKMRPNFRTSETPIYFLGKKYDGREGK